MKNVIITGAATGIGKELALHFAKNNWNVIATMLCLEEGNELKNKTNIQPVVHYKKKLLKTPKSVKL